MSPCEIILWGGYGICVAEYTTAVMNFTCVDTSVYSQLTTCNLLMRTHACSQTSQDIVEKQNTRCIFLAITYYLFISTFDAFVNMSFILWFIRYDEFWQPHRDWLLLFEWLMQDLWGGFYRNSKIPYFLAMSFLAYRKLVISLWYAGHVHDDN